MMNDLRCNAGVASPVKVIFGMRHKAWIGAPRFSVHVHALNNLNTKVNTR